MKNLIAPISLMAILAGCNLFESEQSCYDRMSADLLSYADTASSMGHHDIAIAALDSSMTALSILVDDDRNLCDYVTAEPYLQKR